MNIKYIAVCMALFTSGSIYCQMPAYKDASLSPEERAADLCARLTLEEKTKLMMNSSPAIPRLDIPAFEWWSEGLHGVARNGLSTVFPSCIGMAASFDDDLIGNVFTAVSDEMRAKNNIARAEGKTGKYKGVSVWTPTVNIFRDPRWGRGQESYGEDPYMNGRMGLRVVKALQGEPDEHGFIKLLACAKHFAIHSGPEYQRHSMNLTDLSQRDIWETYMPAFETLVDGGVREVMCAYHRNDGEPCCGSDNLLQQILRNQWGFNGIVVSDCGAITDFFRKGAHGVSADAPQASALAVKSGTDVECGQIYKSIPEAVRSGHLSEKDVDKSICRLLAERFRLGDFDADSIVSWRSIGKDVISSPRHHKLALDMAREQCVLLKNDGILPLRKTDKIMVIGPNAADSTMQWGIYYGQPAHTVTILEGLRHFCTNEIPFRKGCTHTAMTEDESIMDRFTAPDGHSGMQGTYWNNTKMEGIPAAKEYYTSAIKLDNGGNTVFAPGVNLTDFTLRLQGSFVAEKDEILDLAFNNDDGLRIVINGDTVHNRWKADPLGFRSHRMKVEAGKKYDIEIDYMQLADDATLNVDLLRSKPTDMQSLISDACKADVVLFVGGISPALEREQASVNEPGFKGGDRTSIELPECQRKLISSLHDAGVKVVLVNCSGSAVALTPENEICNAILQAWYPGEQGGTAVAEILYGEVNPSGKLPITFYSDDSQLPDYNDYSMAGRTYRYLKEEPLYPFGYGLGYTTFAYDKLKYDGKSVKVKVSNKGKRCGTETVELYIKRLDDVNGPAKTLRGYARVKLEAGQSKEVEIPFPLDLFETWDEATGLMNVLPGKYEILVGGSSYDKDLKKITVKI